MLLSWCEGLLLSFQLLWNVGFRLYAIIMEFVFYNFITTFTHNTVSSNMSSMIKTHSRYSQRLIHLDRRNVETLGYCPNASEVESKIRMFPISFRAASNKVSCNSKWNGLLLSPPSAKDEPCRARRSQLRDRPPFFFTFHMKMRLHVLDPPNWTHRPRCFSSLGPPSQSHRPGRSAVCGSSRLKLPRVLTKVTIILHVTYIYEHRSFK